MHLGLHVLRKLFCVALLCAVVIVVLSSCSSPCDKYLREMPVKKPILIKKPLSLVTLLQKRQYDICALQKQGVQVIRQGQAWTLVFPSDDLFVNDTSEIDDQYTPVLDVAADFLKTYSKIAVRITGYSNHITHEFVTKSGTYSYEFTEAQAASVAKYLTEQNIHARLIYAIGKGGLNAVAWSGSAWGRRLNRRIEIQFRYYRDNKAWY